MDIKQFFFLFYFQIIRFNIPQGVGDLPTSVGTLPQGVGNLPTSIGTLPQGVGNLPTDIF